MSSYTEIATVRVITVEDTMQDQTIGTIVIHHMITIIAVENQGYIPMVMFKVSCILELFLDKVNNSIMQTEGNKT